MTKIEKEKTSEAIQEAVLALSYTEDHTRGLSILVNSFIEESYHLVLPENIKDNAMDYKDNVDAVMQFIKFSLENIGKTVSIQTQNLCDIRDL